MLISRCAWHVDYFGWPLLKGVARWRPLWPVKFTDGICDVCQERLRAQKGPAPFGRLRASVVRVFRRAA